MILKETEPFPWALRSLLYPWRCVSHEGLGLAAAMHSYPLWAGKSPAASSPPGTPRLEAHETAALLPPLSDKKGKFIGFSLILSFAPASGSPTPTWRPGGGPSLGGPGTGGWGRAEGLWCPGFGGRATQTQGRGPCPPSPGGLPRTGKAGFGANRQGSWRQASGRLTGCLTFLGYPCQGLNHKSRHEGGPSRARPARRQHVPGLRGGCACLCGPRAGMVHSSDHRQARCCRGPGTHRDRTAQPLCSHGNALSGTSPTGGWKTLDLTHPQHSRKHSAQQCPPKGGPRERGRRPGSWGPASPPGSFLMRRTVVE
ncbi:uncharacterized protein LOC143652472 isoform X2 [Tamandua tetradactyla]|uniref:uncharacterized protein LOC143652472 isoform X2 n=2 Tax=Tamandua tetradactyla TaxID=48850 RepID=UPI00405481CD